MCARRDTLRSRAKHPDEAPLGHEHGQTTSEYLGVVLVVAAIVGVIATSDIDFQLARGVSSQNCRVLSDRDDCPKGPSADRERSSRPRVPAPPERYLRGLAPPALVPPGQLQGGGSSQFGVDPSGRQSDPVNSRTGAFESRVSDVRLPGPGLGFSFDRSYDSGRADEPPGPLGPGWTHAYAARLELSSGRGRDDALVELRTGAGQRIRFAFQETVYVAGPGVRASLRKVGEGYEVVGHDQVRLRFDGDGRLLAIEDRNGNRQALRYDGGRLSAIEDAAGRRVELAYGSGGRLERLALPDGRSVGYRYDGEGRLSEVRDLAGGVTRYAYDSGDRLTTIVNQNDERVVENEYADSGRVALQRDGEGHESSFEWDPETLTQTMVDARGGEWQDTYRNGALVMRVDSRGATTLLRYDGDLNVVEVRDARGHSTRMDYDAAGNLIETIAPEPLGYRATARYNERNDPVRVTDGRGGVARMSYDSRGNLIATRDPAGALTRVEPDPDTGLPRAVVDALGQRWRMTYDRQGNLASSRSPEGRTTRLGYDESGRLVSMVDPRGQARGADPARWRWTLSYDRLDRVVAGSSPLGHEARADYDAAGRLVAARDAKGRLARWDYDEKGQLTSVTANDGARTEYRYDEAGNLVGIADPRGEEREARYDAAGRLVEVRGPSGERWRYRYDAVGNIARVHSPEGRRTSIALDQLGRPVSMDHGGKTPDVSLSWDAASNLVAMRDVAGVERYRHDRRGQLLSVARAGRRFAYRYDRVGRLVFEALSVGGADPSRLQPRTACWPRRRPRQAPPTTATTRRARWSLPHCPTGRRRGGTTTGTGGWSPS